MPRGDGTGPMGNGPMSGRRMGYCAGSGQPDLIGQGGGFGERQGCGFGRSQGFRQEHGQGRGMGQGNGRGWRNQCRAFAQAAPAIQPLPGDMQELGKARLSRQTEELQASLDAINQRLAALESGKPASGAE